MEKLPHINLPDLQQTHLYTTTQRGGGDSHLPPRNRAQHGAHLQKQLSSAWEKAGSSQLVTLKAREGVYLEFVSDPDAELVTKSLERMSSNKVRLLNVRKTTDAHGATVTLATVYVANDQKAFFANKISQYLNEETDKGNLKNEPLISSISHIKNALFDSFWTDSSKVKPSAKKQWVEVWLRASSDEDIALFNRFLSELKLETRQGVLRFPERAVRVVLANKEELEKLIQTCDLIAEYRLAKTTSSFFMDMERPEQQEWLQDLLERLDTEVSTQSSVCILDTGINNGHPLIKPFLSSSNCLTVDPAWGIHDHSGHGTLMAGTALYGDLVPLLTSNQQVAPTHLLESVKILPDQGANEPNIWGHITAQAVSRAEIEAPESKRTFCMAVAATDTRDKGRPSSWSAELDQLAAKWDEQRLFIVCAGNSLETIKLEAAVARYPDIQLKESVHDPAQAWNALTVGAITSLVDLTDPNLAGYSPVAQEGTLSPFSTTSHDWEENKWPIKPELVLEGGNLAVDGSGFATECDDLSLLSTAYKPSEQGYFYPFNMTSAATAQLAKMAGSIRAAYPDYWEETVRALLVHSAQWPEVLKAQFTSGSLTKADYQRLLSICGYGVPSLDRALFSARNTLTLISQAELQPFAKENSKYTTRDMHFYELPWPKDVLQALPDDVDVKMKVTLSYFIEPGPGEIGWKDRYRYASHALRFEVNNPNESQEEFLLRMNKQNRPEGYDSKNSLSTSDYWLLGTNARNRGSIHSDTWQGTSAELAASNFIAIMPVIGWWRERTNLGRWESKTRYSLIVSIETKNTEVDVYTPIAQQLAIETTAPVSTSTHSRG